MTLTAIAVALAAIINLATPATAAASPPELPMDRVYQDPIRLPDFAGRDQKYKMFRTRIREGMQSGPDFAGHYAVIQSAAEPGAALPMSAMSRPVKSTTSPMAAKTIRR